MQTVQGIVGHPDDPEVSDAEGEAIVRKLLGHPDISQVLSKTSTALDELLSAGGAQAPDETQA